MTKQLYRKIFGYTLVSTLQCVLVCNRAPYVETALLTIIQTVL